MSAKVITDFVGCPTAVEYPTDDRLVEFYKKYGQPGYGGCTGTWCHACSNDGCCEQQKEEDKA